VSQHENNQSPIRVVIADDHLVVREGLRMILEISGRFEVVGEALDGREAIRFAEEQQPHIMLMDLRMPGMDGLDAIEVIKQKWPHISIVILTTYNEDELMVRGLAAGAQGYLLKDTGREALFNTIDAALRGETLLSPQITARLLAHNANRPKAPASASVALTERETEILEYVARGVSNKIIAHELDITERTVKAHLDNIYNKFGVNSRTAAVTLALQQGILKP
jgi:two-component system, NarL family, response regulator YdfI